MVTDKQQPTSVGKGIVMRVNFADNEHAREKYPYRMRNNIASHLERNVCLCEHPGDFRKREGYYICVCSECNNLPVYCIYKCVECDKEFLRDFVLNFCNFNPICFDCNLEDNKSCTGHTYCVTWIEPGNIKPPVVKLKPAFTAEQMRNRKSTFSFNS